MADMIVAGAGATGVNGTYVESGTLNGKPRYYYAAKSVYIGWDFAPFVGQNVWYIADITLYFSTEDVATPDLVTNWSTVGGMPPAPTVTAAGGGDPPSSIHEGEATLSSFSYLRTKKS